MLEWARCLQRLTMQYLRGPPTDRLDPVAERDVVDYIYGAAIYKHWGQGLAFRAHLDEYSDQHYAPALAVIDC
jgi:hypothetical protein